MTAPDQPDLFGLFRARRTDPKTSHESAESVPVTAQAFRVLRAYYAANRPLIDHDAYRLAGFAPGRVTHQRCSDLRHAGLIMRLSERGQTPSGKSAYKSVITDRGRWWVANAERRPFAPSSADGAAAEVEAEIGGNNSGDIR